MVARYRVLAKLGGGGMGVVYEAEDTQLGRLVALKFLPDETADSPEALDRFTGEARAASALNHPHICTVYDFGVHEGRPFLVMERMQGHTLKHVLEGQSLPIAQVVSLGEQICDALDAAHRAGIVHRDIKPANLFVTERGEAKVLDFGLAKFRSPSSGGPPAVDQTTMAGGSHTMPGTALGTIGYMSPEQARGELVDARSDLFSCGVVLYEMATGQSPFNGPTPAVVFDKIFNTAVAPPSQANSAVPRELDDVILGALEKSPSLRTQTAADMRAALKRVMLDSTSSGPPAPRQVQSAQRPRRRMLATLGAAALIVALAVAWSLFSRRAAAPAEEVTSIAVLPFADMSQAKDQEYFADGLSEEILSVLARTPQLRVIGRTSAFQFKGKNEDVRAIASKLGVNHVLEGSVRRDGNRVRIAAELIRASDGSNLWSETYERTVDDVFSVQRDIAQAAAEAMKVTLLAQKTPDQSAPERIKAHNSYLEGRYFLNRNTREDYDKAVASFQAALETDRTFAPAWAGLAWTFARQASLGVLPAESGSRQARDAAQRALGLDPALVEAHTAMVFILTGFDWDWTGADAEVQHLLATDSGSAEALYSAGLLARILGRFDQAIGFYRQAIARDPLNASLHNNLGLALYYAGRWTESETEFRKLLALQPTIRAGHAHLSKVLIALGQPDAALAAITEEPSEAWRAIGLPLAYHALGRRNESDAALRALTEGFASDWAYQIAEVHAFRGDMDQAFKWLDRAYAQRDAGLSEMKGDPLLKTLEADPRYAAFLQKMRLPK